LRRAFPVSRRWLLRALPLIAALLAGVAVLVSLSVVGPGPAPARAEPARAETIYGAQELALVASINQYRAAHGLRTLEISDALSDSAKKHCTDMADYGFVSHYTTSGSHWFEIGASPWDRMAASGYSYRTRRGENIAVGFLDAASVLAAWVKSPTHNTVLLDPAFTVVGLSEVHLQGTEYRYYWTADFGGYVDPSAHPVNVGNVGTGS
jgi:uncharacterized protein YkwD